MTLNRLVVGVTVLFAISFWCWSRPGGKQAHAHSGERTYVKDIDGDADDGNHEDQEYRFRTNQPRHWKHVMLGTR